MKSFLCRKNAVYLALAVIGLSLAVTTHVFAQTTTEETSIEVDEIATSSSDVADNTEVPQETTKREEAVERVSEQREEAMEKVEVRRGQIAESVQNRLINLARNMKGKMGAAVSRMEQITARLERRIRKLEADGVDTTEAMRYVEDAKTGLAGAKGQLDGIDSAFIRAISSDSPRAQFNEMRKQFVALRDQIKAAHTALRNAVLVLKNPTFETNPAINENASTTPEAETNDEAVEEDGEEDTTPDEETD